MPCWLALLSGVVAGVLVGLVGRIALGIARQGNGAWQAYKAGRKRRDGGG